MVVALVTTAAVGSWTMTGRDTVPVGQGSDAPRTPEGSSTAGDGEIALPRVDATAAADGQSRSDPDGSGERDAVAGSITGTVIDVRGVPIEGALVMAQSVADTTVTTIDVGGSGAAAPRDARSDRDGAFAVGGVPVGRVLLQVHKVGFAPYRLTVHLAPNMNTRDIGELRLVDGVVLSGAVRDADGVGVRGARLSLWPDWDPLGLRRNAMPLTTSDESGEYEIAALPLGDSTILVEAEGYPVLRQKLSFTAPGRYTNRDFVLARPLYLEGRVVGLRDVSAADVTIAARRPPAGGGARVHEVGCEPDGTFRFGPVGAADWPTPRRLEVRTIGNWPARLAADVSAVPGQRERVVLEVLAHRRVTFGLRLDDRADGSARPSIRLVHWADEENRASQVDVTHLMQQDSPGMFGFPLPESPLGCGVSVAVPGRASVYARIPEGDGDAWLGWLSPPAAAAVRVTVVSQPDGSPIPATEVLAIDTRNAGTAAEPVAKNVALGNERFHYYPNRLVARTDRDGVAVLYCEPGTTYRFSAHRRHFAIGEPILHAADPSGSAIRIPLSMGAVVVVSVSPRPPQQLLVLRRSDADAPDEEGASSAVRPRRFRSTDATGSCVFRNLNPGRHQFRVKAPGQVWYDLDLAPGETRELTISLGR